MGISGGGASRGVRVSEDKLPTVWGQGVEANEAAGTLGKITRDNCGTPGI